MQTSVKLPLAIEIEINSECNLSCAYCPNSKAERIEKGHMKVETFETLMRQLAAHDYTGRISYHFYNEPLLSPNLGLFIEMTKTYLPKSKAVLFTNGTQLDENLMKQLKTKGLDTFVITEHHQTKLDHLKFLSEDKSLHTKQIKFTSFKNLVMTNRGGILKVGKKVEDALRKPCFIPRCVMVVSVQGNVVACYEDFYQKHTMGNILQTDILEIWNTEKYVYFRDQLKEGHRELFEVCKTCNNQHIII